MTFYRLTAEFLIEADGDREEMAQSFDSGLLSAVEQFPHGDIFQADLQSAVELTAVEVKDLGLEG
jgi:hypothetical protein